MTTNTPNAVLEFWFKEITPKQWWEKSVEFDSLIASRFGELLHAAKRCELFDWRTSAEGRLAEVIVLDQFSRNVYRDKADAFAGDSLALALAQEAVATGADLELTPQQRVFLYMPYMHSESSAIHKVAVSLFTSLANPGNLDFEMRHKKIIDQYGRYPHRNAILGRTSTPAELEFLAKPGSSF